MFYQNVVSWCLSSNRTDAKQPSGRHVTKPIREHTFAKRESPRPDFVAMEPGLNKLGDACRRGDARLNPRRIIDRNGKQNYVSERQTVVRKKSFIEYCEKQIRWLFVFGAKPSRRRPNLSSQESMLCLLGMSPFAMARFAPSDSSESYRLVHGGLELVAAGDRRSACHFGQRT